MSRNFADFVARIDALSIRHGAKIWSETKAYIPRYPHSLPNQRQVSSGSPSSIQLVLNYYSKYNCKRNHLDLDKSEALDASNAYMGIVAAQSYENGTTPSDLIATTYDFGFTYNKVDENGFIIPYKIDPHRSPKAGYKDIDGVFYNRKNGSVTISGTKSENPGTTFITDRDIQEIFTLVRNEPKEEYCYFSLDATANDLIHHNNPLNDEWGFSNLNRLKVKRFSCQYLSETEFGRTMYFTDVHIKSLFAFNTISLTKPWHFSALYNYDWDAWPNWLLAASMLLSGRIIDETFATNLTISCILSQVRQEALNTTKSISLGLIGNYFTSDKGKSTLGRKAIRITDVQITCFENGDIPFYKLYRSTPFTESSLLDVAEKESVSLPNTDNDPRNFAGMSAFFNSYYYHDLINAMPAFGRVWKLLELYNLLKEIVKSEGISSSSSLEKFSRPFTEQFSVHEVFSTGYATGGVTSKPAILHGVTTQGVTELDITNAGLKIRTPSSNIGSGRGYEGALIKYRSELQPVIERQSQTGSALLYGELGLTVISSKKDQSIATKLSRPFKLHLSNISPPPQSSMLSSIPVRWYNWNEAPNIQMPQTQDPRTIRPVFQTYSTYPNIAIGEQKELVSKRFHRIPPTTLNGGIQQDGSKIWTIFDKKTNKSWQVIFRPNGSPDFSPYLYDQGINTVMLTKEQDFRLQKENQIGVDKSILATGRGDNYRGMADKLAGFAKSDLKQFVENFEKPKGYVWHHDTHVGILQFVRSDVHMSIYHVGGASRKAKN